MPEATYGLSRNDSMVGWGSSLARSQWQKSYSLFLGSKVQRASFENHDSKWHTPVFSLLSPTCIASSIKASCLVQQRSFIQERGIVESIERPTCCENRCLRCPGTKRELIMLKNKMADSLYVLIFYRAPIPSRDVLEIKLGFCSSRAFPLIHLLL